MIKQMQIKQRPPLERSEALAVQLQAGVRELFFEVCAIDQFQGEVNVILFTPGNGQTESDWPAQNKRRWELIARMARQGLTEQETQELATLQQLADEQLAKVGPRPVAELERLYAELSQQR